MDSARTPQDLHKLGIAVDLTIKVNQNIKARPKPPAEPTVPSIPADGTGPSKVKAEPLKSKPEPKPEPSKPIWPLKKDTPIQVPKAKGVLDWSKAKPKGYEPAKSTGPIRTKGPAKEKEMEKEKEKGIKSEAPAESGPLDITITDKGKRKITALMDLDDEEEDEPLQRPRPAPKIEAQEPVIDRSANAKVGPPKVEHLQHPVILFLTYSSVALKGPPHHWRTKMKKRSNHPRTGLASALQKPPRVLIMEGYSQTKRKIANPL